MLQKSERIFSLEQRYAMACAMEELLESASSAGTITGRCELLGFNTSLRGTWKLGIRPISPRHLASLYDASGKKDRRFLCTEAQKILLAKARRDTIPDDTIWPTISTDELQNILSQYRGNVPEQFSAHAETKQPTQQTLPKVVATKSVEEKTPRPPVTHTPPARPTDRVVDSSADMQDLLSLLVCIKPTLVDSEPFARLANRHSFTHETMLPTKPAAKLFAQLPDGTIVELDKTAWTLDMLETIANLLHKEAERIAMDEHPTVTLAQARDSRRLQRACLKMIGIMEVFKLPVPKEFKDMLAEIYGTALTTTKTRRKS